MDLSTGKKVVVSMSPVLDVEVYQGDLVTEDVDALVNPSNRRLQHSAGVAAALKNAAGKCFQVSSLTALLKNTLQSNLHKWTVALTACGTVVF